MDFSDEIRNIRQSCLLSQEAFAKELNVSFSTVNRWETGKTNPNYEIMSKLALFCKKKNLDFKIAEKKWKENRNRNDLQNKAIFADVMEKKLYVDFFSGCGGLSLGLGLAKWNGLFAVEKDPMAFATFKRNLVEKNAPYNHFRDWPQWLTKSPHSIEEVLDDPSVKKHLESLKGKVVLVAGGPPCQGFSVAGARNGNDPRNLLVFRQIDAIRLIKPLFCIVENVGGFARKFVSQPIDGINVSIADAAKKEIENLGYNVGVVKINAADYGVPQIRERVIIFGILKDFAGTLNASKLFENVLKYVGVEQRQELNLPTDRYVNIEEALSDLSGEKTVADPEFPKYKTVKYLSPKTPYQVFMRRNMEKNIPNCHRFNNHNEKAVALYKKALETQPAGRLSKQFLYDNNCHSNKRFVLDVKRPSSTLTTAPEELIHYKHPRVVTLREMARLQSFPDNFEFLGRYTLNGPSRGIDVPRNAQIGNAIPPLVGRALGRTIEKIATMVIEKDSELENYR